MEPGFGPRDTPRQRLMEEIDALLRRATTESQRLGHEFAARHGLHPTDFEALVHVMDAEGAGQPLTPGQLATRLQLSSGATTAVVDRLERAGHLRRERDVADRRKVQLHWAEYGMAVALDFFGGLAPLRDQVMGPRSDAELETVRDFLAAWTEGIAEHRARLTAAEPPTEE